MQSSAPSAFHHAPIAPSLSLPPFSYLLQHSEAPNGFCAAAFGMHWDSFCQHNALSNATLAVNCFLLLLCTAAFQGRSITTVYEDTVLPNAAAMLMYLGRTSSKAFQFFTDQHQQAEHLHMQSKRSIPRSMHYQLQLSKSRLSPALPLLASVGSFFSVQKAQGYCTR